MKSHQNNWPKTPFEKGEKKRVKQIRKFEKGEKKHVKQIRKYFLILEGLIYCSIFFIFLLQS